MSSTSTTICDRGPVIRRATAADGPAVRAFVLATFADYGIEPDFEGLDADLLTFGEKPEPVDAFVAVIDGTPVGSVMVAPAAAGQAWLSKFFVDRSRRGAGIGRALLSRAVEAARARGYASIALETRTAFVEAIHLYESTGWVRSSQAPDGPCEAHYTLQL